MRYFTVSVLLYCISCVVILAQEQEDDIFSLLEGVSYNKNDTVLLGNGYHIRISKHKVLKISQGFLSSYPESSLDIAKKYSPYKTGETPVCQWQDSNIEAFYFEEGRKEGASHPTLKSICYVHKKDKQKYAKVISFLKVGSIDTVFTNKIVSSIINTQIPANLFKNEKDSVNFIGRKISLKGYAYKPRMIDTHYSPVDAKKKENFDIIWDYYKNPSDIDDKINYDIAEIKDRMENRISQIATDTVLFRNQTMQARRITTQYKTDIETSDKLQFATAYFINTKHDSLNLFLNVNFTSDTNIIVLPQFVNDNIFKLVSYPSELPVIRDTIPVSDTIFIPKKNRMPIWSYYDNNTRINGLSLGFLSLSKRNNVTNNGIRIDAIGSGVLVPLAITMGFGYSPLKIIPFVLLPLEEFLDYKDKFEYEFDKLFYNRLNVTNGMRFSTTGDVISQNSVVNGLSFGGIINLNLKQNGLSVGGVYNYAYKTNGMQIGGLVASSIWSNGLQVGLSTQSLQHKGVQLGAYNYNKDYLSGIQFGLFNRANNVYGIQIGIFNSTKLLRGLQIGLWNKNGRRSLPLFNW